MSRFYAICKEVIGTHGGTLEKFIGDAIMAVFGLPQAHGDDAQRALNAAMELRDRIREDVTLRDRVPVRLGVSTGEVVATRDSTAGDFLITGDAVNVAARLQQAAEPWSIVCSARTARAAGDAFAFGQFLRVVTKGKAQPVRAYSVLGRSARVVKKIPLIGRDTELAHLEGGRVAGVCTPPAISGEPRCPGKPSTRSEERGSPLGPPSREISKGETNRDERPDFVRTQSRRWASRGLRGQPTLLHDRIRQ